MLARASRVLSYIGVVSNAHFIVGELVLAAISSVSDHYLPNAGIFAHVSLPPRVGLSVSMGETVS